MLQLSVVARRVPVVGALCLGLSCTAKDVSTVRDVAKRWRPFEDPLIVWVSFAGDVEIRASPLAHPRSIGVSEGMGIVIGGGQYSVENGRVGILEPHFNVLGISGTDLIAIRAGEIISVSALDGASAGYDGFRAVGEMRRLNARVSG